MSNKFSCMNLEIEDVKLIKPFYLEDERGYFLKNIEKDIYKDWGLEVEVYETFETYSKKGVIRGLHFQTKNPQAKIVRVIKGEIRDVVVDLRVDSKSFGKHIAVKLSEENHNILWIPQGFAHGFEVLSEDALVSYVCIGKYLKEYDTGIVWNDVDLDISWETKNPIVSEKDASLQTLNMFRKDVGGI